MGQGRSIVAHRYAGCGVFLVDDAASSGHPLDVAWAEFSFARFAVKVRECAVHDIGHGLLTTVRMDVEGPLLEPVFG